MTVYLRDPAMAADHRDWTRSEVDGECIDLACNLKAPAVNTTIAGYPAIQQIIAAEPSCPRSDNRCRR